VLIPVLMMMPRTVKTSSVVLKLESPISSAKDKFTHGCEIITQY